MQLLFYFFFQKLMIIICCICLIYKYIQFQFFGFYKKYKVETEFREISSKCYRKRQVWGRGWEREYWIEMGMRLCEGRFSLVYNESVDVLGLFCVIFFGEVVLSVLLDKQCVRFMKIVQLIKQKKYKFVLYYLKFFL